MLHPNADLLYLTLIAVSLHGCRALQSDTSAPDRDRPASAAEVIPPRDDSPFQTAQLLYIASKQDDTFAEAVAVVTYRNRRSAPVYVDVCARKSGADPDTIIAIEPRYSVVEAETGEYADGIIAEWACVGATGRRRVIEPGSTLVDSVFLIPYRPPWCQLAPNDPRGLFRVTYKIYDRQGSELDQAGLLPLEARRSNVFRLICEAARR